MTSRYLTGYSKGVLTIRDRMTGKNNRVSFVSQENADHVQQMIADVNYEFDDTKSGECRTITDDEWLARTWTQTKQSWGDIPPSQIQWTSNRIISSTDTKEEAAAKVEQTKNDLLNDILEL